MKLVATFSNGTRAIRVTKKSYTYAWLVMDEIAEDERKARDQLRRCEIRRQIVKAIHKGRPGAAS